MTPTHRFPSHNPQPSNSLIRLFIGWTFTRAVLHNGWWLVVSLYMVVDARLTPAELLLIAAAQGVVSMIFEIPAGVLGDTLGRKPSIIVSHLLMGAAMVLTGLFPSFGPLMAAQMLWGISWTFSSGSDVAWATDEIQQPDRMHLILAGQARAQLIGAGAGMIIFGGLAAVSDRQLAIVTAGGLMLALGIWFAATIPERHFVRVRSDHFHAALSIASRGLQLIRTDRTLLMLVIITVLVNGAGDSFARIYPVRLAELGLPDTATGTAWFAAIGLTGFATAALVLLAVQRILNSDRGASNAMIGACLTGFTSFAVLSAAPSLELAIVAVIVAAGVAMPILRTVTTIWVNRRTTSDIRATTHSFLAQAEYLGEILCALGLAALAGVAGASEAILLAGGLFLGGALVLWRHTARS